MAMSPMGDRHAAKIFGIETPEEAGVKAEMRLNGPLYDARNNLLQRSTALADRPYSAFTGNRVAGLSGNEGLAGEQARGFARTNNGAFDAKRLSQFENPYLDRVLSGRKRAIGEEFDRQAGAITANRTAKDAFRSGRSDLMMSRLGESRMRALDDAEAETRSSAFDRAIDTYYRDQESQRGAFDVAQRNLMATGMNERSVRQAQSDFDYGQFLEKRDWDVNNLTPLLNAVAASRGGNMQPGTGNGNKEAWGAIAGMAATAVGQWLGSRQTGATAGTPVQGTHTTDDGMSIPTWRPSIEG